MRPFADRPARIPRPLPVLDHAPAVDRRTFLGDAVQAAAAALLLAACGGGGGDGPTGGGGPGGAPAPQNRDVDVSFPLASTPALGTVGGIARAGSGITSVAVVRTGSATFRAFSLICPHAGTIVNVEGAGFVCPNHNSAFTATGAVTRGPATAGLQELTATFDAAANVVRVTGRV
jgi:Rieske Fe-S protein